jgi:hypothetical protein
MRLVLDIEQCRGVVHLTVAVVVVADRAIEQVISQQPVEALFLRRLRSCAPGDHTLSRSGLHAARAHQLTVDLDHAGIAALNRTHLRVIADMRQFVDAQNRIDKPFAALGRYRCSVHRDFYRIYAERPRSRDELIIASIAGLVTTPDQALQLIRILHLSPSTCESLFTRMRRRCAL